MKEDRLERNFTSEINKCTKQGTAALQKGKLEDALKYFESSFNKCLSLGDAFTERACAFNVGAVHISLNNAKQGLAFLQRAIPPSGSRDGRSNGDLYYNFGLAYERLDEPGEAVKYYELALDEYKEEGDNCLMESDVGKRAGAVYSKSGQWLPAARCFGIAATASSRLGDTDGQTTSLCRQAACLYQADRHETALQAADECSILCQRVKEEPVLGRLYNELGLTYTQCHEFAKAATCFELALPLSRSQSSDRYQEAIILQNLGAVYNSLGDYQRALPLHEAAILIHAELEQRNSQGQCFQNLAFACSQMEDHEAAGECYLHALQAAKDTRDRHGQCQALEGLGAVAYNEGRYKRASRYFKMALKHQSEGEPDPVAVRRLHAKLESAQQAPKNEEMSNNNATESIMQGRQDSFDIEALRSRSRIDGAIPERENSRHLYKGRKSIGSGLDVDQGQTDGLTASCEEFLSKSKKGNAKKRKTRGLLREEQHDSEDEWRNTVREIYSPSSSEPDDLPYKERRYPHDDVAIRSKSKNKKRLIDFFDDEEKWMEDYHKSIKNKHGKNRKRHSKNSSTSPTESPIRRNHSQGSEEGSKDTEQPKHLDAESDCNSENGRKSKHEESASDTETKNSNSRAEFSKSEEDHPTDKHQDDSAEESQNDQTNSSNAPPPPIPSVSPMGTTYELPQQPTDEPMLGDNRFRLTSPQPSDPQVQQGRNDENEPIYSTLKSVKTLPFNLKGSLLHPNDSDNESPDVPPRPGSNQAKEFLEKYQEERNANLIQRKNTIAGEGDIQLPARQAKKSSKFCSIM